MNRTELYAMTAERTGLSIKDTAETIDATLNIVAAALKSGEEVRLLGFGTFAVRDAAAKEGHNPRTGTKIAIPAKRKPMFKAGKGLRDAVAV